MDSDEILSQGIYAINPQTETAQRSKQRPPVLRSCMLSTELQVLTLSQMKNFRLFQIERVYRRQCQI